MEIEAKILEIDPKKIINHLEQMGAIKVFDGEVCSFFYDTPAGEISKRKDLLRLRRIGKDVVLTYKQFIVDNKVKQREEYEVEIGNLEQMDCILRSLGFVVTEKVLKKRVSFKIDNTRVDIDVHLENYSYIPPLLEIEAPNVGEINKLAVELGYSSNNLLAWDFFDLARYYLAKNPK
jgi:predicted adenylyl cyclase CyaB